MGNCILTKGSLTKKLHLLYTNLTAKSNVKTNVTVTNISNYDFLFLTMQHASGGNYAYMAGNVCPVPLFRAAADRPDGWRVVGVGNEYTSYKWIDDTTIAVNGTVSSAIAGEIWGYSVK